MKTFKLILSVGIIAMLASSCASKKSLETVRLELDDVTNDFRRSQSELENCNIKYTKLTGEKESLQVHLANRL